MKYFSVTLISLIVLMERRIIRGEISFIYFSFIQSHRRALCVTSFCALPRSRQKQKRRNVKFLAILSASFSSRRKQNHAMGIIENSYLAGYFARKLLAM